MDNIDLPDDSDSSDEDYMPSNKPEELPSEVESDGDSEDPLSESDELKGKSQKRRKRPPKSRKKRKNDDSEQSTLTDKEPTQPAPEITKEEEKKKDDDLWADFIKDTGFRPKNAKNQSVKTSETDNKTKSTKTSNHSENSNSNNLNGNSREAEKVKITQIFEFAGEEVRIEKEVNANSAEGRLLNKSNTSESVKKGRGQSSLSGISNVLSQIGKKQKISTLEKSKLDWDKFKKEENLEEELLTHNKGKDGYLEKQDFLMRADLRRFEIEKEVRSVERSRRLNN